MRDMQERLRDILEAIERIERHAVSGRRGFDADELLQVWVIHHLQIIGEACRSIPEEMRESCPQVPWTRIIGMRNILVHHYFGIDAELVWSAVESELPALKSAVLALLAE